MEILKFNLILKMCKDETFFESSTDSTSCTTSDSDDTDDLLLIKRKRVKHIKIDNFFSKIIPLYSDMDFKAHFRLSRISIEVCIYNYPGRTENYKNVKVHQNNNF